MYSIPSFPAKDETAKRNSVRPSMHRWQCRIYNNGFNVLNVDQV